MNSNNVIISMRVLTLSRSDMMSMAPFSLLGPSLLRELFESCQFKLWIKKICKSVNLPSIAGLKFFCSCIEARCLLVVPGHGVVVPNKLPRASEW